MSSPDALRVLHVISGDLWAGAEAQVYALLGQLRQHRDVMVQAVVLNEGVLSQKLRDLGIPVVVIREQDHGFAAIVHKLSAHIKDIEPHLVHTHRYKENILGSVAARRSTRPRLVTTVHGSTEPFGLASNVKMRFYQWLNRMVMRKLFDSVICVSNEIRTAMTSWMPEAKLHVIHNALEPDGCTVTQSRAEVRRAMGIADDLPLIGTVGRLVPVKALHVMIQAMHRLVRRVPSCRLVIVGDGPLLLQLRQQVKDLNLDDVVAFLGFRGDVLDVIGALDVMALSSMAEGVPMVVLEAMALRTPIVATNVGGLPEILEHGATGLLVEPGNSEALAEACESLVVDPERRRRLTERAYSHLVDRLSTTHMAQRVEAVYRRVIAA